MKKSRFMNLIALVLLMSFACTFSLVGLAEEEPIPSVFANDIAPIHIAYRIPVLHSPMLQRTPHSPAEAIPAIVTRL